MLNPSYFMEKKILLAVLMVCFIISSGNSQGWWNEYIPDPNDSEVEMELDGGGGTCPCGVIPTKNAQPYVVGSYRLTRTYIDFRADVTVGRKVHANVSFPVQTECIVTVYSCIFIRKDLNQSCCACQQRTCA